MKRFLLTVFLIIPFLSFDTLCQNGYRLAGLRTGYRGGIFFQMNSEAGYAGIGYQAMLGFNNNGIQVTGLRIIYGTTISEISPDLYFAWGYGGHAGFMVTDNISYLGERYTFRNERICPLAGIDGWVAVEYRFREYPVVLSLNIKPFVELTIPAFVRLRPGDLGISAAYVF